MELCRGCKGKLPEEDLLVYEGMPKGAQAFLTKEEIANDEGVTIRLKQCRYCGLVQATGEPVNYYRDVIRATGVSEEMRLFREKQYREWAEEFGLVSKPVLEVGCGKGEYMSMMEKAGCKVFGIEHLKESVEAGRTNGHDIAEAFIESEESVIPRAPFLGFYIMNFLEHIPDPGEFLRGIAGNLEDGGAGLVEVPNFDMMLEKSLYSEFIQDHVSYYTKDTLRGILERNGFEVISCESIWYDYILSAKVRKRTPLSVTSFNESRHRLQKEVEAFLSSEKAKGHKIAVWGAGHQALANLSLLNMAVYLECVIDSAPFKQGKYTPVTHLPIVAPEVLAKGEIDTLVVMVGGYNKEVSFAIKRDYPFVRAVVLAEKGIEF